MKPIRLLIVDDQPIVLAGLRTLLGLSGRIQVIGEAETVAVAIEETGRLAPDVVLLDLRLSDGSGVEACREIRRHYPAVRVLVLTSCMDDEAVLAAMMGGAHGYLLKSVRIDDLSRAIEKVAAGETVLDPALTKTALTRTKSSPAGPALSAQEGRIMALLAEGRTNKEIAASLDLSEKTVKNYLSNIFHKLNVTRRSQAVALFARRLPG
ncbi:MAG: response regulator transcription factor [Nitrospirota bacterium]|nr:response regulator transcription factor [Nitrospirota bacterium]